MENRSYEVQSVPELRSSPKRPSEPADDHHTVARRPCDLHPASHHSRGPGLREQSTCCSPRGDQTTRHKPTVEPIDRDRTGTRCSHGLPPGLSATATAVAAVGRATAAVAPTVSELLSEPRASEHEGGSHTGVCEGLVAQRVLSASPPSQAASSAEELEELLDEPLHTTCADSAPPASMELHLWQAVRMGR